MSPKVNFLHKILENALRLYLFLLIACCCETVHYKMLDWVSVCVLI